MRRAKPSRPKKPTGAHAAGWHRAVYRGMRLLWKIPLPTYEARILGRTFTLPMGLRGIKRYGSRDLNEAEWRNYSTYFRDIPSPLRENFALIRTFRKRNGKSFIGMEAVRNKDGTIAQSLDAFGKVRDPLFWSDMHRMMEWMIERKIPFFDIRSPNFMVRDVGGRLSPVLIDYKTASMHYYGLRIWLYHPALRARFMRKRLEQLEKKFREY